MLSSTSLAGLKRRSLLTAGSGAAAASLIACGTEKPRPRNGPLDEVTFVSGFTLTGQDSFMFVGIENGYYRDAGITVTVVPGTGTRGNLVRLKEGSAQFAVIDITGGLLELNAGIPVDFRVFGSIYQNTVSCIVAQPSSGIQSPKDLPGKRIAYFEGGVNKTVFPAYARLAELDEATIKWQPLPPPSIRAAFLAGQVDAAVEVVPGRPALEAASKKKITVLPYSDYVRDLYSNALGASTELTRSNPDLVRRFRDATLRSIAWTIENPTEAGRIFAKHVPAYQGAEVAAAEVRETVPYVRGSATILGQIDEMRMNRNIAILQGVGVIKPGMTPDRIVALDLVPTG